MPISIKYFKKKIKNYKLNNLINFNNKRLRNKIKLMNNYIMKIMINVHFKNLI